MHMRLLCTRALWATGSHQCNLADANRSPELLVLPIDSWLRRQSIRWCTDQNSCITDFVLTQERCATYFGLPQGIMFYPKKSRNDVTFFFDLHLGAIQYRAVLQTIFLVGHLTAVVIQQDKFLEIDCIRAGWDSRA